MSLLHFTGLLAPADLIVTSSIHQNDTVASNMSTNSEN
jgi:hypothetical protein